MPNKKVSEHKKPRKAHISERVGSDGRHGGKEGGT